jgi:hypothetical protein
LAMHFPVDNGSPVLVVISAIQYHPLNAIIFSNIAIVDS